MDDIAKILAVLATLTASLCDLENQIEEVAAECVCDEGTINYLELVEARLHRLELRYEREHPLPDLEE